MRILILALVLVGCAPKGAVVEDAPAWKTEKGRRSLKHDLIEAFLEQRQPDKAMTLIAQLYREGDESPELQLFQGEALMQEGMGAEAERLFLEYQKGAPRDPRSFRLLGVLYADAERIDDGIAAFEQAIALDDTHAATWNNTGFLLLTARRYEDAVEALQRAVELDGTQSRYRNNLGFALAGAGRWAEAFEAFRSAGPPADAYANLGLAYELAGDPATGLEHYTRALKYNPSQTVALEGNKRLTPPEESP